LGRGHWRRRCGVTTSTPFLSRAIATPVRQVDGADVVDKAIDAEIQYKIPAESVQVDRKQWDSLMAMQKYLKNVKGTTTFEQIVDNSFAEKAAKAA